MIRDGPVARAVEFFKPEPTHTSDRPIDKTGGLRSEGLFSIRRR
jgi:hypothetical protein